MMRTEVTQEQFKAVMGYDAYDNGCDDVGSDANMPVVCVSWLDAVRFANALSVIEGLAPVYTLKGDNVAGYAPENAGYRLPTEAEWEYAARATTDTVYWWGDEVGQNLANCDGCDSDFDGDGLAPVATFDHNPWFLYDTVGNVWEWVEDDYHESYESAPSDGSAWVDEPRAEDRVMRGGSWFFGPAFVRAAYRGGWGPGFRDDVVGFRLSRSCPSGVSPSDCLQNNK